MSPSAHRREVGGQRRGHVLRPASVSAQKKRLARSPHFSSYAGPFGLEQKAFCSLGAAVGESGRDGLCERRRTTRSGTQEWPLRRPPDRP